MAYQSQSNALMAYKVQSGQGVQSSGSGATQLRLADGSAGLKMTKAVTESAEVRPDGMRSRGRHGIQKTSGAWNHQMSVGSCEPIIEAIVRDTWGSTLVITEATSGGPTSITIGANSIVGNSGSWIVAGLKVNDVIRGTNLTDATNNSKNIRITGLTALIITTAETLVVNATPDTSFTITRPKKLIQYAGGVLVPRWFTAEDYEGDIDGTEVATDFAWTNAKVSMAPNGILMLDPGGIGTGQFQTLTGASAPLFTSPALNTATPLAVVDATLRLGTTDLVELSAFDLTMDIGGVAPETFGSAAQKYSPTIFTGQMGCNLSLTALRKDLAYVANYIAEDVLTLHCLAVENTAEPKGFVAFSLTNFTFGSVDKSALNRAAGGRTQTIQIPVGLVGKDETGGAYDATMIKWQSTGA
jgi:Phage tail tube protein